MISKQKNVVVSRHLSDFKRDFAWHESSKIKLSQPQVKYLSHDIQHTFYEDHTHALVTKRIRRAWI